MSDKSVIGAGKSRLMYLFIFLIGVWIGLSMRFVLFLIPSRGVEKLKEIFLPGYDREKETVH